MNAVQELLELVGISVSGYSDAEIDEVLAEGVEPETAERAQ